MTDAILALGILGWFGGACFFIWDDINRLCRKMQGEATAPQSPTEEPRANV